MSFENRLKLEQLGLSPAEAQIYLAVLQHGPLAAPAIASQTGVARTSVYPTLCSLAEKGLIEGGLGHGSKFTPVAPEEALQGLIAREEQTLSERQQIANELARALPRLAADAESALDDSVQVIRTPQLIGERLHRLQLEATRFVEGIVKAPILMPQPWNPAQRKAVERGVRYKGLYERAAIEDPKVAPYLQGWLASGEEARVYDGDGMGVMFESFWNQAQPLTAASAPAPSGRSRGKRKAQASPTPAASSDSGAHNGAARR
ncbi:MAG: hypothetical protein LC776_07265 [Acidobacteria bacterium]|nr:hypothetical protein [Acidobacteriota bacterium]